MLTAAAEALVAQHGRAESRRLMRHALWRRGELSWALHARQIEDAKHVEAAYARGVRRHVRCCGRRYGKTRGMVVDAFEHVLRTPGALVLYAAMTWASAVNFVIPEAQMLIDAAPEGQRPVIVGSEILFPWLDARIRLAGCEDRMKANRLRGPRATRGYIDEAGFIPELQYVAEDVMAAQLLTTDGMLVMGSSPPESPSHPFVVRYMVDAESRGALIRATTADAPHVHRIPGALERFYAELGGILTSRCRREAFAEIVVDETRAVLPEWTANEDVVVGEVAPPTHRHWYVAADLGYVHLSFVLLAWFDFASSTLVVEDERVLVRPTSADVQRVTAEMEAEHVRGGAVRSRVADAPAVTLADMRSQQRLVGAEPSSALHWHLPFKDDLEAAVNAVRLRVGRHTLRVHPRCRYLIAHCRGAIWNKSRTSFEETAVTVDDGQIQGGHFDGVAALVYLNRSINVNMNPEPAIYVPANAKLAPPPGLSRHAETPKRAQWRVGVGERR